MAGPGSAKTRRDDSGWKRGAMGIDGNDPVKLARSTDYTKRGISPVSFGEPMKKGDSAALGALNDTWAPGPIKQGNSPGRNKGRDYGTSPNIRAGSSSKGDYGVKGPFIKKYMAK